MRVLFVDDEVRVLEALERVLFEVEPGWEMAFLTAGDLALAELARVPYDVIVSDLRMPGIDGVGLLTRVSELYPRMVRVVLSGHSDEEAALKMVLVAHQFLAKPCGAETLHQVIARTQQLMLLLPDKKLQTLVGQVGALPSPPSQLHELWRLAESDDASANVTSMARLIKQDPAMTCKLLQVASSAFFNSSASISDVEAAVMRLGFRTLKNLAFTLSAALPASPAVLPTGTAVEAMQARSLAIAHLAASMARLPEDASAAYLAGLLCDVGQLVLEVSAPERLYVTQAEATQSGSAAHVAELQTWGVTHAEIGAYLLGLWGLPFQIVEAVAHHHAPGHGTDDRLRLVQLVWLASCIVENEVPTPDLLSRFGAEDLYATHLRAFREARP